MIVRESMTNYRYVSVALKFNLKYTGFEDDFVEELNELLDEEMGTEIQIAVGTLDNEKLMIVLDLPLGDDYAYNTDGLELAKHALDFSIDNGIDLSRDLASVEISFCEDELDD